MLRIMHLKRKRFKSKVNKQLKVFRELVGMDHLKEHRMKIKAKTEITDFLEEEEGIFKIQKEKLLDGQTMEEEALVLMIEVEVLEVIEVEEVLEVIEEVTLDNQEVVEDLVIEEEEDSEDLAIEVEDLEEVEVEDLAEGISEIETMEEEEDLEEGISEIETMEEEEDLEEGISEIETMEAEEISIMPSLSAQLLHHKFNLKLNLYLILQIYQLLKDYKMLYKKIK